jgi:hypothetical protein
MHRSRAGGAGVLDPRRALEAQIRGGLQHQRGGEILRGEAGIEMAEHDLIDVAGRHAGIAERLGRNAHYQALDRLPLEPAERSVRPSNDASRHGGLLVQQIWVRRHRMSRT